MYSIVPRCRFWALWLVAGWVVGPAVAEVDGARCRRKCPIGCAFGILAPRSRLWADDTPPPPIAAPLEQLSIITPDRIWSRCSKNCATIRASAAPNACARLSGVFCSVNRISTRASMQRFRAARNGSTKPRAPMSLAAPIHPNMTARAECNADPAPIDF